MSRMPQVAAGLVLIASPHFVSGIPWMLLITAVVLASCGSRCGSGCELARGPIEIHDGDISSARYHVPGPAPIQRA
jgi:hypothetical protein